MRTMLDGMIPAAERMAMAGMFAEAGMVVIWRRNVIAMVERLTPPPKDEPPAE